METLVNPIYNNHHMPSKFETDIGHHGGDLITTGRKRRKLFHDEAAIILPREKYTVGWISALPLEMAAASAMLDEIHNDCGRSHRDNNTYILGSMAGHNCVVACLPAGNYGTVSATNVASEMRFSFPSLRFWLMVGVGGGAPTENADIRLGDVVVSMPTSRHHGVVQYDYGKTVANGKFEHTGKLNKPPPLLLTAIAKVQAEYWVHSTGRIPELMSDMLQRHPKMTAKYSYRGQDQDVLFETEYEHSAQKATCDDCNRDRVKLRPPRGSLNPVVHYGTIASGNQVIKHARTRDKLARELGILCFEMEAAGLMDNFPCLAIRGICDYSDSHKNKQWQEYAAATAAAYAKELLLVIPSDVGLGYSSHTTEGSIQKRQSLIESLRFNQIQARQDTIQTALPKTCNWLLKHEKYRYWLDSSKILEHKGFLWIKGKPGTGKSTIMKHAFEHSRRTQKGTGAVIISFFFNARGEDPEKSTAGMYRSLLLQLFLAVPAVQNVVDSMEPAAQANIEDFNWNLVRLQDLFRNVVRGLGQQTVICFIDALDECREDEIRDMVDFFTYLSEVAELSSAFLHICFSSRHYPYITFDKGLKLILEGQEGHSQDLSRYLNSKLSGIKDEKVEEVKLEILEKSSGIFLWVVLVVDILRRAYDQGRMNALRRRLSEIPRGLTDLFKDILTRDRDNLEDLFVCLQWILFSKRPLKPNELYFAIQSRNEDEIMATETPIDASLVKRFILSSSKGLAELTSARNTFVQFIHESVRDFLLKDGGMRDLLAELHVRLLHTNHELLKHCCHNYIKMSINRGLFCTSIELPQAKTTEMTALREKISAALPFLEYAIRFVLHHADQAEAEEVPQDTFIDAFPLPDWIYAHNFFEKHQIRRYSSAATLMYIIADEDLSNLIKVELRQGTSVNIAGERYCCPILAALVKGNMRAVGEFLNPRKDDHKHNSDIRQFLNEAHNYKLLKGKSLVTFVIENNHGPALRLLLDGGWVHPNVTVGGELPLEIGIKYGLHDIVQILLDKGADVNGTNDCGEAPLFQTAHVNNLDMVQILLDKGANVNTANNYGETPLSKAAHLNNADMVQILLDKGANVNTANHCGETPLFKAIYLNNLDMVQMMLTNGAEVNPANSYWETPLSAAIHSNSNMGIIQMLLTNGAAWM
jgi:nucleoside phosphorylase